MLQDLKFSAATIGLLAVVQGISTLLSQNKLGHLSDRLGARKVQLVGMILIPLITAFMDNCNPGLAYCVD